MLVCTHPPLPQCGQSNFHAEHSRVEVFPCAIWVAKVLRHPFGIAELELRSLQDTCLSAFTWAVLRESNWNPSDWCLAKLGDIVTHPLGGETVSITGHLAIRYRKLSCGTAAYGFEPPAGLHGPSIEMGRGCKGRQDQKAQLGYKLQPRKAPLR